MKIEIPSDLLKDLALCTDKVFSKPKRVTFIGKDGDLTVSAFQDSRQVYFTLEKVLDRDFSVAVEAAKFIQSVKNFYGDTIHLIFEPKLVKVVYGNACIKLPYVSTSTEFSTPDVTIQSISLEFLNALTLTTCVDDKEERFDGILVEPRPDGALVAKFSSTLLVLNSIPDMFTNRFIISSDFAKVLKTKSIISGSLFSDKLFGLRLESGVKVVSPFMDTDYPTDFTKALGLSESGSLVKPEKFNLVYKFDLNELYNAVNLVSSVVGDEEFTITFNPKGIEESSGKFIWCIFSRSHKNVAAEELIRSECATKRKPVKFKLHKKQVKKLLDNYKDTVTLIDHGSFIIFCDEQGNNSALLSKLG